MTVLIHTIGRHMLPTGWEELPYKLNEIDTGMTPYIWGVNSNNAVFLVDIGNANHLVPVDGTMHHVSAGDAGVWAIGLLGNIFFREGVDKEKPKGKASIGPSRKYVTKKVDILNLPSPYVIFFHLSS